MPDFRPWDFPTLSGVWTCIRAHLSAKRVDAAGWRSLQAVVTGVVEDGHHPKTAANLIREAVAVGALEQRGAWSRARDTRQVRLAPDCGSLS